ncbi:MAG: ABC transporter ATP-binding protein [Desulfurococcales archaeon]|nr:ABC transporter ATP-binding protein [Desulfurococcales archaeon]
MATFAIETRGLRKRYRTRLGGFLRGQYKWVEALRGVSFHVDWGEIYGLLGPNGAGKTTTVKIIATLLEPDSGDAFVAGYSSVRDPGRVRQIIGVMLSVERGFFWKLTARENLKYFGMLYGLPSSKLGDKIEEVLELTGLKELGAEEKRFEDMSLGMKARLGLARALLKDPQVLLLDEPTLGLDPPSARHIRGLLRELANDGRAVLVTTHNMFEAEILCDRIGIISDGRIVAEGPPQELKRRVSDTVSITATLTGIVAEGLSAKVSGSGYRMLYRVEGERVRVRIQAKRGEEVEVLNLLTRLARDSGTRILEVRVEEPTLEDVFIAITGGGRWE